ncbi:hypothetical protein D3C80_1002820 [compost metagenome]
MWRLLQRPVAALAPRRPPVAARSRPARPAPPPGRLAPVPAAAPRSRRSRRESRESSLDDRSARCTPAHRRPGSAPDRRCDTGGPRARRQRGQVRNARRSTPADRDNRGPGRCRRYTTHPPPRAAAGSDPRPARRHCAGQPGDRSVRKPNRCRCACRLPTETA